MSEYTTKYFGKVSIDDTSEFESVEANYKGTEIRLSFHKCNIYGNKIKLCFEMLDKYIEINEVAKKAIVENFPKDDEVKYYFECHFDMWEEKTIIEIFGVKEFIKIDIKNIVENLKYPNFLFGIDNNKIKLSVDYMISKEYSDEILCVKMDEDLNVINFSVES
jgi:hypothetical protein